LKPLSFIDVPEGGRLVSYREGVLATVSVVENAQGVATLHINNRQQEGSTATGDKSFATPPKPMAAPWPKAMRLKSPGGVGTRVEVAASRRTGALVQ